MYFLNEELWFPPIEKTTDDGLLAIGGNLSTERLLLAYNLGIFPWFENGQPILWWSPKQRMVLFPEKFKISKSLKKVLSNEKFTITYNQNFSEVIKECAQVQRKGQNGTWITNEMQEAYISLHKAGHAVSIEVWEKEELVGGLYGVDLPLKKVFCGESMFSKLSEASKVGFYHLSQQLISKKYKLIDCQIYNDHLRSLGAEEIERKEFLEYLSL